MNACRRELERCDPGNVWCSYARAACVQLGPTMLKPWANSGTVGDYKTIGETIVDLEDRWFCEQWRVRALARGK